jgi:rubredoxin
MICCPKCGNGPAKNIRKSILYPEKDKFKCEACSHVFYRYDKSNYLNRRIEK